MCDRRRDEQDVRSSGLVVGLPRGADNRKKARQAIRPLGDPLRDRFHMQAPPGLDDLELLKDRPISR